VKSLDAHSKLLRLSSASPIFQSSDAAAALGVSPPHARVILLRLFRAGLLIHLKRGYWAIQGKIDPLILPEHLTAPFPSYISLQTALYYHGMISQIPEKTYAVSLSRTQELKTPIGVFSIHHIQPSFFFGYESKAMDIKIATPEKALLDFLYLSPARSHLFHSLPELELPKSFSNKEAREMISRLPAGRRRTLLERKFEGVLKNS
jgi:predicted transcriptional regulator of viral defense system